MAGEILRIVGGEKHGAGKLVRAIEQAVAKSFMEDRSRVTGREARRRTSMCITICRELRGDMKWTIDRIASELPVALRARLDGIPWSPSEAARRSMFAPEAATVLAARDELGALVRDEAGDLAGPRAR